MPAAPRPTGTVHLVRHGEVENPRGIVYGRLPGFNLSERGMRQAEVAAGHLAGRDVGVVRTSPLERAQETAGAIAAGHGLEPEIDLRLIESATTLEGVVRTLRGVLASPRNWWSLRNPIRPSWGESFADIRVRMLAALEDALATAPGREAVLVSHQTPVLIARLALENRRTPPWLGIVPCATGSVTTLEIRDGRAVQVSYRPGA